MRPVGPTYAQRKEAIVANTYSQIYIQIVFAVENRQNLIEPKHNDELQKYISGIVTAQRHKLIVINNMPDHIHLLVGQRPDSNLSDLVGDIKSGSTNFINRQRWVRGRFNWQEGFGAFSYSRSQLDAVVRYIRNQQRHHRSRSFRDEYLKLLRRFGVQFDERYVFKFIE
jgi:REP element-mobilizing transposase RayT